MRFALLATLAVLVGTLGLLTAPAAHAVCGDRRVAVPKGTAASAARPPLAIGDSVLYDAVPSLSRAGVEGNAMICRRMDQGLTILRQRRRQGTLPHLVILELGANWIVTRSHIRQALSIIGTGRRLVMLTPTDDDPPRGVDAKVIRAAGKSWPSRLTVLEWARLTARHPAWMAKDGVHLAGAAGIAGMVALIRTVLPDGTASAPTVTTPTATTPSQPPSTTGGASAPAGR